MAAGGGNGGAFAASVLGCDFSAERLTVGGFAPSRSSPACPSAAAHRRRVMRTFGGPTALLLFACLRSSCCLRSRHYTSRLVLE